MYLDVRRCSRTSALTNSIDRLDVIMRVWLAVERKKRQACNNPKSVMKSSIVSRNRELTLRYEVFRYMTVIPGCRCIIRDCIRPGAYFRVNETY